MRSLAIIILVIMVATVSLATTYQDPKDLIKAATTRPWPGANYPSPPTLSSEMLEKVASEITGSEAVRMAYEKPDARRRNVDWFEGVAELEEQKAIWSLLSRLSRPSDDVQYHSLRALKRLEDKRAVPFLLIYAESMAVYVGGSEQTTACGLIAETLSTLTGISLTIRGQNPRGLMEVVRQCREWIAGHDTR
ncbi:MAG: hypothetical protein J2P21_06115 [Chloracidobacterium sp.]|nr:hypothetical protein [Chloracidobacterium sp.]